ncbi:hypothetical protein SLA2020_189320 [Shorea laevis]
MGCTPRRELQLQGPRPAPLKISNTSSKIKKTKLNAKSPVVIYLKSPEIIHVRPEEFMGLVQRLTGKDASSCDMEVDESMSRRDLCGEEEETLKVDYGDQGVGNGMSPTWLQFLTSCV